MSTTRELDLVCRSRHSRRDARRRNRRDPAVGGRRDHRRRDLRHRRPARRRTRARRRRPHREPGVRRHPHPLRRPGVLGPGAQPVVLARRHERRGRQLRVLDRTGAARAPRAPRAHVAARRGHVARHAVRGRPVAGLRDVPAVLRRDRAAGHAAQLRVLRRPHGGAALRDGDRRLRARGNRRRDPRHATGDRRSVGGGRRRLRDVVVDHAQRRQGSPGTVAHRRRRGADRAARAAARRGEGRRRAPAGREGHPRRRVRHPAPHRTPADVDRAADDQGLPVAREGHGGEHHRARRGHRGLAAGVVPAARVPDEPARAVHVQHARVVPRTDGHAGRGTDEGVSRSRVA